MAQFQRALGRDDLHEPNCVCSLSLQTHCGLLNRGYISCACQVAHARTHCDLHKQLL